MLDLLLEVPPGKKVSELERWRTGPSKASGPQIVKSLDLVAEIGGTGLGRLELDAAVPQRRLDELARYGLTAHSSQLRKHPASRRLATLLATAQRLETKTIDDTLELLDLLMVTELLGKAQREADKQNGRAPSEGTPVGPFSCARRRSTWPEIPKQRFARRLSVSTAASAPRRGGSARTYVSWCCQSTY